MFMKVGLVQYTHSIPIPQQLLISIDTQIKARERIKHTNRARGVRAGKFHVSSATFVYLSFGQSLISKGLLDKKTGQSIGIKDGQREGGEAHRKSLE